MNEVPPSHALVRFGVFGLDTESGELRKQGVKVRLQEQPFQILQVLLEHPGKVVTREELQQRIWPSDTFVDFDRGLYNAIKKLREALGDSAENPRFIETLSRRGYRFIAPVAGHSELLPAGIIQPPDGRGHPPRSEPFPSAAGISSTSHRSRKGTFLAVAGSTVVALMLGALVLRPKSVPPQVQRYVQLTNNGTKKVGLGCCATLATDGTRVYYDESVTGSWVLAQVSSRGGGEAAPLATPFQNVSLLDISPDDSKLIISEIKGSAVYSPLWSVSLPAGSVHRIGDIEVSGATWSNDDKMVYAHDGEIYSARPDGSESRKIVTVDGIAYRPRLSLGGRIVRFTVYSLSTGLRSLWEVGTDGSNLHRLFPDAARLDECCGVWTPDGRYFVFQSTQDGLTEIWVEREDRGPFPRGSAEPKVLTAGPMNFLAPAPSLDGKQLFVVGQQIRGELMRFDFKLHRFLTYFGGLSAEGLDFSRDGKWVVYASYPDGTLWRSRLDGSQRVQLTFAGMKAGMPRWSPDGKRIAFTASQRGQTWKIYQISADGGSPQPLTQGTGPEFDPSWSQDGESLVFAGPQELRGTVLHTLNLKTQELRTLPGSEGLFSPRWSLDGRFIAALSLDSMSLRVLDLRTDKWTTVLQGQTLSYPNWSRNGRYIYFCDPRAKSVSFYRVGLRDHKLELVTSLELSRGLAPSFFGFWTGLAPDQSPLLLHDASIEEIYALDVKWH